MYPVNFSVTKNRFFLSLHYNETNSYLFVDGKETVKFKAKDSEIVASPNISKGWSTNNMKNIGLNGSIYEFNVDYNNLMTQILVKLYHLLIIV